MLGHEGLEVINPDGGKEDVEEEAHKGRWRQEVRGLDICTFIDNFPEIIQNNI